MNHSLLCMGLCSRVHVHADSCPVSQEPTLDTSNKLDHGAIETGGLV